MSEEFEKKLKQKVSTLRAKQASQSQLEDKNKIIETTLVDNKKALKKLKNEIEELLNDVESSERTLNDMKLMQKHKEEEEVQLRIQIERKIREEMEIKRKVEEEMSKMKKTSYEEEGKIEEEDDKVSHKSDRCSYCDVCDKQMSDNTSLKKHLQSKQHLKVVDEMEKQSKELTKKRKAIPKAVRTTLWNIHFSEDKAKGNCKVCDGEIKISNFEAGHVIASASGGTDNLDNLLPLCSLCNKSMGTENLLDFKTKYFSKTTKSKTD